MINSITVDSSAPPGNPGTRKSCSTWPNGGWDITRIGTSSSDPNTSTRQTCSNRRKLPVDAAAMITTAASTGSFRRFEQVCLVLVFGSLLLVPILVMSHPPLGQVLHDFLVPGFPGGAELST